MDKLLISFDTPCEVWYNLTTFITIVRIKPVSRYIWSIIALVGVSVWLFFSYVPSALPVATRFSALSSLPGSVLQILGTLSLLIFVGVQLWLLYATFRLRTVFAQYPNWADGAQRGPRFQLLFAVEFFWTALPLLITLGMAYISYQSWVSLSAP